MWNLVRRRPARYRGIQLRSRWWTPDRLRILIRRSKTDQEGQGAEVAILRGYRLRPAEAVQAWLVVAEISEGPVFRARG